MDPDTQLRLMTEAANQVSGKNNPLDYMTEFFEPVIGEHSTVKDAVLEIRKNYKQKTKDGRVLINV